MVVTYLNRRRPDNQRIAKLHAGTMYYLLSYDMDSHTADTRYYYLVQERPVGPAIIHTDTQRITTLLRQATKYDLHQCGAVCPFADVKDVSVNGASRPAEPIALRAYSQMTPSDQEEDDTYDTTMPEEWEPED